MKLLIVSDNLFQLTPSKLVRAQELAGKLDIYYCERDRVPDDVFSEAEVIFGCPNPEQLRYASHLKWHHLPNAGIEPFGDLRLYADPGVILTNSSGVYGKQIAEHVIGLFLALSRQFPYYSSCQAQRVWDRREDVRELSGSTVAVLGLGDLGTCLVQKLRGFDCTILGVRKNLMNKPMGVSELFPLHRLHEVLAQADYVAACLPQTLETIGLMNKPAFAAMKPGGIFVNVGRGSLVVEDALAEALNSGRLMGAGIDVADPEPLDVSSHLWGCENILITAHSSAASPFASERRFDLFSDLLTRYRSGRKLYNQVDFFRGY